jgi:hypothetical protein
MNARPTLAHRPLAATLAAVVAAAVLSLATITAVAGLFARDGAPLADAVAAEQACAHYAFVSERERCMQASAAARVPRLATR